MAYTWHAVDLRNGKRGPELQVRTRGKVKRIIGEATDCTLSVLIWDQNTGQPVPEWRDITTPIRMAVVLVDDEDVVVWAGQILRRVITGDIWVELTAVTFEHYLGRRYPGSRAFNATEQANIAASLILRTNGATESQGFGNDGLAYYVDAVPTGVIRTRDYLDADDKTVLSTITDLMNIQNGIEFTVDVDWAPVGSGPLAFPVLLANTFLRITVRIATRIGKSLPTPTRFEMPGPVQSFTFIEDNTVENYANDVIAVSSGEGTGRPQSANNVDRPDPSAPWIRVERRFTPSTSITSTDTLNQHAADELDRVKNGLLELTLVAHLDTCPRLNVDWFLGDDITAVLTCPAFPERVGSDKERIPGYLRTVRVVGWEIDLDARTLTPSLREYR